MPHHVRATSTASPKQLFTRSRGPYHFIAGGVCCVEINRRTIINVAFILLVDHKVCFLTEKVFINRNQSVLNRFSSSGLNPSRPGS